MKSEERAERVYVWVQHVARRLRASDLELGLTPARFSALASLVFHGGPMNLAQLARFERVRPPTITRLVRELERDGLVTRRPDPDDGRAWRVAVTAAGRRLVERSRGRKIRLFEEHLAGRPPAALRAIDAAFDCLEPLGEDPE